MSRRESKRPTHDQIFSGMGVSPIQREVQRSRREHKVMTPNKVVIGDNVRISEDARINVSDTLIIGSGTVINYGTLIEGRSVILGRENWLDEYAHIGGGSCFEKQSEFVSGDFFHLGKFSHVNTTRSVKIGDEVALGRLTNVFTHGDFLSVYDGFPVEFARVRIGNRVLLPHAWVNPGVTIGDDVVVASLSLVNRDIPSGALAAGIPAKVIKEHAYPQPPNEKARKFMMDNINEVLGTSYTIRDDKIEVRVKNTVTIFDVRSRTVAGRADQATDRLRNQLRRLGIRFRYSVKDGEYIPWQS